MVLLVIWAGEGGLLDMSEVPVWVCAAGDIPAVVHSVLGQDFGWLEFFAGTARCTRHVLARGVAACKFDITYHEQREGRSNFMDVQGVSGFPFPSVC